MFQHTRDILEGKLITVFHIAHFTSFSVHRNIFNSEQRPSSFAVPMYNLHSTFPLPHFTMEITNSRNHIHTLFSYDALFTVSTYTTLYLKAKLANSIN